MTRSARHHVLLVVLTALLLVVPAGRAWSDDGITFDPGSPSGKEYAIPLDQERREATGQSDAPRRAGDTTTAPLFGAGVGDAEPRSAPAQRSSDGDAVAAIGAAAGQRAERGDRTGRKQRSSAGSGTSDVTRAASVVSPSGDAGSRATIGAVALCIILLGVVLGSIVRRRSS